MQIQKVNRTDAEKIYANVTNGFATTLTTGYVCAYDIVNVSTGGTVSQVAASNEYALAGVAVEDIAADGAGRIQVYGVCNEVYISTEDDGPVEIGQVIGATAGQWYAISSGTSTKAGNMCAAQQFASNTLANAKVFLRLM